MGWDILVFALPALLGLLLVSAGIQDARTRQIGNGKNAAIALLAPLWWVAIGLPLWPGIALQIGVAAIVFGLFCVAFHFGQMGGGDVKLIGALALWLPFSPLLVTLLVMSIAGGVLTVVMLAEHRLMRSRRVLEIPYGVAIVFAALLTLRQPLLNHFT